MIKRKAKANYKRREERTLEGNRRYEAMIAEKDRVNTIKYKKVKAYMDDYNEKHPDKPINLYHAAFNKIVSNRTNIVQKIYNIVLKTLDRI